MSFGKRIKEFIDYKGLTIRSFEIQSTLKNGAIYRVVRNHTTLNGDSIAALGKKWTDLNLNWLMNGVGDMLLVPSVVNEPVKEYIRDPKAANEIKWYRDALKRADDHIKLQKDMIDTLNSIIENQKKAAAKAGIEL